LSQELCEILNNGGVVSCFLTDQRGEPLDPNNHDSITCDEIQGPNGRENIPITLPDGQHVTLQKVRIRKSGFIVVRVTNGIEECHSNPIPFSLVESSLLCAPEGTDIICQLKDFQCFASVNCQQGLYESLEISLDICQEIQVITDVVIEISSDFCHPRKPIRTIDRTVNLIPPQFNSLKNTQQIKSKQTMNTSDLNEIHGQDSNVFTSLQQEPICVKAQKVYDWIVHQANIQIRKNANEAPFVCETCTLGLFVPAVVVCEDGVSGTVECDGELLSDQPVTFSTSPNIVSISPNPAFTDSNGNFTASINVPIETDPTPITVTANTNVNGQILSKTLPTTVRCLADPCVLLLFGPDSIECNGQVSGRVRCGNEPIEGVEVTLSSNPNILTFNPNPSTTGSLGNYFTGVTVPYGTPPIDVEITASAIVDGQLLSETIIVNVQCKSECKLTLTSQPLISCEGEITGFLTCNGDPIESAQINFSNFPEVGTFAPNPAISDVNGMYTTTLTIPEGTPLLTTSVTATSAVDDQIISDTIGIQVECPEVECPCKFRLGIEGNAAPTTVTITEQGVTSTLPGTINVTVVQCFTASPMCNPAVDNFNIAFGSEGTTINFIVGRRIEIECGNNNFARVRGTARATGNVFSGIFEVLIEVTIDPFNVGTWTIFANDYMGRTFSTTFTAPMNPIAFIGDCGETP
jgi:hypothetical protein